VVFAAENERSAVVIAPCGIDAKNFLESSGLMTPKGRDRMMDFPGGAFIVPS
jgi:hypothetical protein